MFAITGAAAGLGLVKGRGQPSPTVWQQERQCLHSPGSMLPCPLYSNQFSARMPPYSRSSALVFGTTGEQDAFFQSAGTEFGGRVNLRKT
jgi:hypothetical protein